VGEAAVDADDPAPPVAVPPTPTPPSVPGEPGVVPGSNAPPPTGLELPQPSPLGALPPPPPLPSHSPRAQTAVSSRPGSMLFAEAFGAACATKLAHATTSAHSAARGRILIDRIILLLLVWLS
jgi:hypothetical protein